MKLPNCLHRLAIAAAAMLSAAACLCAKDLNTDYITPAFTHSPGGRYGVKVPVFHADAWEKDDRQNQVVELATKRVVAVIPGEPGYDRGLNFRIVAPPRWSADESLLLWKVEGKWCPDALALIKIEKGRAKWQINLLRTAQQAILARTRKAAPKKYLAAKKENEGNGSAYPEGFTIDVTAGNETGKSVKLPLAVHAHLSANPKAIEDYPANLDAHLDAVVGADGAFVVRDFRLGARKP